MNIPDHGGSQHRFTEYSIAGAGKVEGLLLRPSHGWPNNQRIPVLIYRGAMADRPHNALAGENASREEPPPVSLDAAKIAQHLSLNGWRGSWENGVFSYHHFHSNAHEVLVVCEGEVRIFLGGPEGCSLVFHAGDAAILPAGTSHKNAGSSPNLRVVGAYPAGQEDFDLLREVPADKLPEVQQRIESVPLPKCDPIYGRTGPLVELWSSSQPA